MDTSNPLDQADWLDSFARSIDDISNDIDHTAIRLSVRKAAARLRMSAREIRKRVC